MGAYLDRLNEEYDQVRAGIDTIVNRAAEENRDVTDTEQQQVDRDQQRLTDLQPAISRYAQMETDAAQVADIRSKVRTAPQVVRSGPTQPEAYDLLADFPTAGDYAVTVHRAMVMKAPDAMEKLERATQHQLLADNPGLVPKPVLGPVLNLIDGSRPFITSISRKALPAGKFSRPYVDQHVAVAEQAAEKTLTASQKLTVLELDVVAKTYAGHLNISRQDIKWTSPGILQIVFDDFAVVYAITTCAAACADFVASVSTNVPVVIPDATGDAIIGAMYEGAADALTSGGGLPDTMWVSPDVWAQLGGTFNANGTPAFPQLSLTNQGGNPQGLQLVVDQHFPNGTMITGPSRLAEWYEDVDGLMQVGEPDVLGQLVGYAGFAAFLNVAPDAFTRYTLPAAP
jgi:hypothetical protein